jgi:hypothetical protein
MVTTQPFNATSNPLPALVRYVNAGSVNHPMHPHGNHLRVIGRDGRPLVEGVKDASFEDFTRTVGSGQTYDTQFWWTDGEQIDPTGPLPVLVPSDQNLAFKDGETWWSGTPYLGKKDPLPVGVVSRNACGEYYFPWHSHALNEFANYDAGFGGMATLGRIDPPGGCPATAP